MFIGILVQNSSEQYWYKMEIYILRCIKWVNIDITVGYYYYYYWMSGTVCRSPHEDNGHWQLLLLEICVGFLWILIIMLLGIRKCRNDKRFSCLFIFAASRVLKFADTQNVDAYITM